MGDIDPVLGDEEESAGKGKVVELEQWLAGYQARAIKHDR